MPKLDWTLGGKKVTPRSLKAEILDSYRDAIFEDISAVQSDLQDLLDRLNRRTTKRGRGFYAVRYNKPFEDAEIEVKTVRKDSVYRIRVKSNFKGDSGYRFNVLDAGIPERVTAEPMVFPAYDGNLTKAGNDSFILNRSSVKVEEPTRWIVTNRVRGADPRHFYEDILRRGNYKNRKRRSLGKGHGSFDFRLSADTKFTVVKDK